MSNFKSREKQEKLPFSPIFFTGSIILAKDMIQYNVKSFKNILKNAYNLGHSILDIVE